MQKPFVEQLNSLGYLNKKILVAVSGGLDSIVLLDLFVHAGCKVGVAHANFQLRGEESDKDEAFVIQLGARYQVPVFVKRFDTKNYATENGMSIQMAARELRYDWFRQLLVEKRYDYLATAHHLNDSIETILINLTRGTGLQGLIGIQPERGSIIRPLAYFTREQIEAYGRASNLQWREDSSNSSDDYTRNFIRHQVIPKLKEINPSLEETFTRNMQRWSAAKELMDLGIGKIKREYLLNEGGQIKISKSLFAQFKQPAILWELIKECGFTIEDCDKIVIASEGQSGKRFLSSEFQLVIDRELLIITPLPVQWSDVQVQDDQTEANLGSWELKVATEKNWSIQSDPFVALIDRDKLIYPLTWRLWREGDYFFPLGMDNKKKISDFLIDSKIAISDKDHVTVVESAGEIVWIVGYRIDNRFKITDNTKSATVFRCVSKRT